MFMIEVRLPYHTSQIPLADVECTLNSIHHHRPDAIVQSTTTQASFTDSLDGPAAPCISLSAYSCCRIDETTSILQLGECVRARAHTLDCLLIEMNGK